MSTPAQVTEAHIALSARITRENGYDPESAWNRPHVLRDAQYIADSEAKAVEQALAKSFTEYPVRMTLKDQDDARAERDQLRADVDRILAEKGVVVQHGVECLRRAMRAEREVERLTKQIKDDNRSYGCELRDPYGTIWEQATKDHARAEKSEAELKEWSLLNLWGGTPEIIHAFVKGQQARIHAAQDVEGELESTKERALTLANSLDKAEAELATERARLDWLEGNAGDIPKYNSRSFIWFANQNLRAAIDAAMKEGA